MSGLEGTVYVPGLIFLRGDGSDPDRPEQAPAHRVCTPPAIMGQTPVTFSQFEQFLAESGYQPSHDYHCPNPARLNTPVTGVNWHEAQAYCQWMSTVHPEYTFSLPTSAMLEGAARGGKAGKRFPWGNEAAAGKISIGQLSLTGSYLGCPSVDDLPMFGFGLKGIVGAVWQWCQDGYDPGEYARCQLDDPIYFDNPQGDINADYKSRYGGAANIRQDFRAECATRSCFAPTESADNLGFRWAAQLVKPDLESVTFLDNVKRAFRKQLPAMTVDRGGCSTQIFVGCRRVVIDFSGTCTICPNWRRTARTFYQELATAGVTSFSATMNDEKLDLED